MAFVRIVLQEFDPAQEGERVLGPIQAAIQSAPGLQLWIAGGDPAIGRGAAISVWDTREQAEIGIAAVIPDVGQRTAAAGLKVLSTHVYPVESEVAPGLRS